MPNGPPSAGGVYRVPIVVGGPVRFCGVSFGLRLFLNLGLVLGDAFRASVMRLSLGMKHSKHLDAYRIWVSCRVMSLADLGYKTRNQRIHP